MDFDWSPELLALRAEAEEAADKAIAEYGEHDDAWINGYSREFSRELGRRGWLGMTWPKEYGGQEIPGIYEYILNEALSRHGAPQIGKGVGIIGKTLIRHGSEKLKRAFLPKILDAEIEFALGYSEPQAGSDAANMQLRAVKVEGGWKLDGQKIDRPFIKQDIDFYKALCQARLALSEGGDKKTATDAMFNFVRSAPQNYHFYDAAEALGDLAMASGKWSDAAKYYGPTGLAGAPWADRRAPHRVWSFEHAGNSDRVARRPPLRPHTGSTDLHRQSR